MIVVAYSLQWIGFLTILLGLLGLGCRWADKKFLIRVKRSGHKAPNSKVGLVENLQRWKRFNQDVQTGKTLSKSQNKLYVEIASTITGQDFKGSTDFSQWNSVVDGEVRDLFRLAMRSYIAKRIQEVDAMVSTNRVKIRLQEEINA